MTEKQAWLDIAKSYSKAARGTPKHWEDRELSEFGLCNAVSFFEIYRCVSRPDTREMRRKIDYYAFAHDIALGEYFWPISRKYAAKRAALARRFAKKCK